MKEDQTNDHAQTSPHPNSAPKENQGVPKEFITFLEKCIAGCTAILAGIAAFFAKEHSFTSAMLTAASSVVAVFYIAFIHYLHVIKKIERISPLYSALFCGLSLSFLGIACGIFFEPSQQIEKFHFEQKGTLASYPTNKNVFANLVAVPSFGKNEFGIPIQILTNISVTNVQQNPTRIVAFSMSDSEDNGRTWEKLCPISFAGRNLFWTYDRSKSIKISTDNFLENSILEKELSPRDLVSGWTAWECKSKCEFKLLKFTVREANGSSTSGILQNDTETAYDIGVGFCLIIPNEPTADLSATKLVFEQGCR